VPILLGHLYNSGARPAEEVDWEEVRRLYGGDVYTADMLLGRLIHLLKRVGEYENTVLIVTSDHGENLGDHNLMDHQFSLHETLLAVPLVIRAPPGLLPRGVQRRPVVLTDLYATLLAIAGVTNREPRPHSLSLIDSPSSAARRPIIAEYAGPSRGLLGLLRHLNPELPDRQLARAIRTVRVGNLRLTLGSDGSTELHDLMADPAQLVNLADAHPDAIAQLKQILREHTAAAWVPQGEEAELDSLTRRQLESLGYIR
jgi:arylsulfatase A-like enzyme